jgi:hypothetical protein
MLGKDGKPSELTRGDLIQVDWVDISEDSTGNPDEAELAFRTSYGLFWKKDVSKFGGLPVVVTTTTMDPAELTSVSGYCIYPESCIIRIKIIKKARRQRGRGNSNPHNRSAEGKKA